jgi:hypothetical protein
VTLEWVGFRPILPVVFIPSRFVYLIAGLCSLSVAGLPLLLKAHESRLFVVFWIGAVLFLVGTFPWIGKHNYIGKVSPLLGSIFVTSVLFYRLARPKALRFTYARLVAYPYQPSTFERIVPTLMHQILTALLIVSAASLLISVLMILRGRNQIGSPPLVTDNR